MSAIIGSPVLSMTSFEDLSGFEEEHSTELLVLDSLFRAVKKSLPGLTRDTKSGYYYIQGKIKAADKESLYNYTKRIGDLTLGMEPHPESRLASHVFVRIAQLQDAYTPLFPSLYCLRIIDTSPSLDFLHVLLSSALTTLELTAIAVDNPHYSSVLSFLECAIDEAPDLTTLILGPGLIDDQILDISLRFRQLRRLEFLEVGITITDQLLRDIGSLQDLEALVLRDNGTSTYNCDHPISSKERIRRALESEEPHFSAFIEKGEEKEHPDLWSEPIVSHIHEPTKELHAKNEPISGDSLLFLGLRTLKISGGTNTKLIEDLVEKVSSPDLQELSIDFTQFLKWMSVESVRRPQKVKKHSRSSSSLTQNMHPTLRRSVQKWGHTLVSVTIKNYHTTTFSMASDVFETLLLRPNMKYLEITGIDIAVDSMDSTLRRLKEVADSKLEGLRLPAHFTAQAIPLACLRYVAEACPHLESFRCRFCDLSNVSASDPLSHGLKELSVSNEQTDLGQRLLLEIAHYLDSMFPNLKSIQTHYENGDNPEEWRFISDLVKLCQAVRKEEEGRRLKMGLRGIAYQV